MRRLWGRWRGYLDELEEAMRVCGEHLRETEAVLAEQWERATWRGARVTSLEAEWLRRAMDVPFFRELLEAAWRVGPDAVRGAPPDVEFSPWTEGEARFDQPAASRAVTPVAGSSEALAADEMPPARLRAAERALAERTRSLVVVLDELCSPRNTSAVVRTAESLGLQEVHCIAREGRVKLERTVTRLAQRWIDLHWYADAETAIAALRGRGYAIWVCDYGNGSVPISEVPLRPAGSALSPTPGIAACFGSEQRGIGEALGRVADVRFHLPTVGFTSYINVSVAAGVALYTLDHELRAAGLRAPLGEEERVALRRSFYANLARGNPARLSRYLAWLDHPPEPAPPRQRSGGDRR